LNSIQGLRSGGSTTMQSERSTNVQPPPRRWRTRIGLPALLLLIVVALLIISSWQIIVPATPVQVVPVVVKSVEGSAGSVTVQAPGWLEPDPYPYYVVSLNDGVVEDILVLEGESVTKGQIVARLVDEDATLALRQAEAMVGQREAELTEARAAQSAAAEVMESLVDRRRDVATAQSGLDATLAAQRTLDSDIKAAEANLATIDDELTRKRPLVASGTVSEGALRRLELQHASRLAAVDSLKSKRDSLEAALAADRARVDAARQHMELLIEERRALDTAASRLARAEHALESVRAARDEAQLALDRTQITSPITGVVLRRLASPGSYVMASGPEEHSAHVLHVYDPAHLQVRADVPLVDAGHVGVGQRAEVVVDVLPDRVFDGEITRVTHQADIAKNTLEVKVRIDNPTGELKPEMLARVRLLASQPQQASTQSVRQRVFAPRSLVQGEGDGATVLVATSVKSGKGIAQRRQISLGTTRLENWIEITSGLQPGDQIIATSKVEQGQRIRIAGEAAISGIGGS